MGDSIELSLHRDAVVEAVDVDVAEAPVHGRWVQSQQVRAVYRIAMASSARIYLDLTGDTVTMRELRVFLAQAEHIGANDDQDLRIYDDEPALVALQAVGALTIDGSAR